ncbi:LCP family protein [Streptomyces radicis]|uniref:LytR family transcriptional regulator n=1 Tax=Streptomyces radicis TaxID=1750517 RepID=A0A3A9WRH6_9ACTN|nr:LCP family protein [Streptomyces radicis]RKN08737.1 LytR family transcriptional regulator [Streptomyces radicis]RKN21895.1 LytR family transcriptional regulator [Streptomyces radicis]
MSDWPDGWTDDHQARPPHPQGGRGQDRYGQGSGSARPENARVMPHVGRPPRQRAPRHDDAYDSGYNEGQLYQGNGQGRRSPAPPPPPPPPEGHDPYDDRDPGPRRPRGPVNWRRRIGFTALALALVLLVTGVGIYFWADGKLRREVDLASVEDRPTGGQGTNYLIVGSDSREGMSEEEQQELHTGSTEGQRTDTIMILHVGDNGNTMVSLPRDSWVTIPEFTGSVSGNRIPAQQQKLNAAYAIEGPELLVRTIEYNTGLRIDHYAEIGFGGFANVVDALGGVEMCFDEPIQDENSGADFEAGCHQLNGAESLAFNRQRYQEAMGDLGRTQNQQEFLGTLADQAASPSTLLNPFTLFPTMNAGLDALIVDEDMSLWSLRAMFWGMRGAERMNIPVADPGYATEHGSAVLWDMELTEQLISQLENDEQVTVTTE